MPIQRKKIPGKTSDWVKDLSELEESIIRDKTGKIKVCADSWHEYVELLQRSYTVTPISENKTEGSTLPNNNRNVTSDTLEKGTYTELPKKHIEIDGKKDVCEYVQKEKCS